MVYPQIIDKYYAPGSRLREVLVSHSRQVADLALEIMRNKRLPLDAALVEDAAMLHDIGILRTDAPGIECRGSEPYIRHGIVGAEILRNEGVADEIVRVAMSHTGTGLTPSDIADRGLPLPPGDYMPHTTLERLICYADKFYSKSRGEKRKTLQQVRATMARLGEQTLARFEELHREFGQE
ncbi:MAG: HDIG domain-containing protein [Muribaculaceae bacterium]|nr:HDIG domain-containing protein [Muribaculaceae bacterium]